ncbi:DUF397 domain-containing protein [Streptomyces sp. NPDC088847]|uniref:DUF397 domain-containing protein n=1 Tax=Streptomyces sp. NPDC088847 TaxID=3365909 RepID=UPI003816141B
MFDNEYVWQKSSFCGNESECLEFVQRDESVMVRDSKMLRGSILNFPSETWSRFVDFASEGR